MTKLKLIIAIECDHLDRVNHLTEEAKRRYFLQEGRFPNISDEAVKRHVINECIRTVYNSLRLKEAKEDKTKEAGEATETIQ